MGRPTRYSPAFRTHAVAEVRRIRPQYPSEWATIQTVAAALAVSAETLRLWLRQAEPPAERGRADVRRQDAEIRRLARENSQLKRAIDLLRRTGPAPRDAGPAKPGSPIASTPIPALLHHLDQLLG
ncbi:transposase [Frankia canadensis]|uniref:Transposase n=2 Tax=Frankia canadensis TaxID=1836972 RepID=A0A2I2KNB7_9ACTN|nr:transposase [Frankia canadensis]SOU54457.1 transposase [Frankia canadensis]